MADDFLDYYRRELDWLRAEGREFQREHQGVASRLDLGEDESRDPHTERLLEGFAFLTGRIQKKIDDDFPELTDALLSSLYPALVRPIPSTALVEVLPDLEQAIPAEGLSLRRNTVFLGRRERGLQMKFRSTKALRIWPIVVRAARIEAPDAQHTRDHPEARAAVRIRLEAVGEFSFGEMEIDKLSFYLHGGDSPVVAALSEAFATRLVGCELHVEAPGGGVTRRSMPASNVQMSGFGDDEALMPFSRTSFSGYRPLLEYFACPEKFRFYDVSGWKQLRGTEAWAVDLVLLFDKELGIEHASLTERNLKLFCVPLVNLFEAATSIPVLPFVTQTRVVPDSNHPAAMEIYSIESVTGVSSTSAEDRPYARFYDSRFDEDPKEVAALWHEIWKPSSRENVGHREVSLGLVDLELKPTTVSDESLLVKMLCTNGDLPGRDSHWSQPRALFPEKSVGIDDVRCLRDPSPTYRAGLGGKANWRLVSQLSLNYLSLVRGGKKALQQMLRVYDLTGIPANQDQIDGIARVESDIVWLRVHGRGGSGLCRGTETTIWLDRNKFVGSGIVAFAAVLERFLALYCANNTFSQLVLKTVGDKREVYRWKARAGEQITL